MSHPLEELILRPHIPRWRQEDPEWLHWVTEHPAFQACIFCGDPPIRAHLRSKGASGSDYWIHASCNACHMEADHTPRGRIHIIKEAQRRQYLAVWWAGLPLIWQEYLDFHLEKEAA